MLADQAGDPQAVRLAAWFHDAVYDGRPGWDEERSAQLAQSRLPRCGVPAARIAEVARLVRLTAAHDTLTGTDRDGAVLCDADLAVLGGDGYEEYAAAIRQEYAHVLDDLFRQGRAQVLRRLLAVPELFRTPLARELWKERARAHMNAELDDTAAGALAPAAPRAARRRAGAAGCAVMRGRASLSRRGLCGGAGPRRSGGVAARGS